MIDALAIAPNGIGTGEAQVLAQPTGFRDFTNKVLEERRKQGLERQKSEHEVAKLLAENVQSKWAQDNINVFQPQLQALKEETIDLYKQNKGRLNSVQLFELQNKMNKIKSEVQNSNNLYEQELGNIKQLTTHADKLDIEESEKLRKDFADPMSNPALAKEVATQFGGNINAWRAANAAHFGNILKYDPEADAKEFIKNNTSKIYKKRDAKGEVIWDKTPEGILVTETVKGFDPEKSSTAYNTFWNREDRNGRKFRQTMLEAVNNDFVIEDDGSIRPNTKEAIEVFKNTKLHKGMEPEQIKTELAKQYGIEYLKNKGRVEDIETKTIPTPKPSAEQKALDKMKVIDKGNGDWELGGFTYVKEDPSKFGVVRTYNRLGIPSNDNLEAVYRVNTGSTGALPKQISIADPKSKYANQMFAPELIAKGKSGKYWANGIVTEMKPDPVDQFKQIKVLHRITIPVSEVELKSSLNLTDEALKDKFGATKKATAAAPTNNNSAPKKKKLPGT